MTSGVACRVGRIVGAEAAEAAGQETASDSETGSRHSAGPPARARLCHRLYSILVAWLCRSLSLSLSSRISVSHTFTH